MKRPRNKFPKGWSVKTVRRLIKHYETQTEAQAAAEDEAAARAAGLTPQRLNPSTP